MGDEADALIDLALGYEEDTSISTYCCWCKKPIILIANEAGNYKPHDDEETLHNCPEVDLSERRLSANAIIGRILLNF